VVQEFHLADENQQRMVAFCTLLCGVVALGCPFLIAANRFDGRTGIQYDVFKPAFAQPSGILAKNKDCSLRAPFCPSPFKLADMASSLIALSSRNNTFTKPSPLKAAIRQIRMIPLTEAKAIAINIWFTPNLVALCLREGNAELIDFTMS
jgi:hypothetical protein